MKQVLAINKWHAWKILEDTDIYQRLSCTGYINGLLNNLSILSQKTILGTKQKSFKVIIVSSHSSSPLYKRL